MVDLQLIENLNNSIRINRKRTNNTSTSSSTSYVTVSKDLVVDPFLKVKKSHSEVVISLIPKITMIDTIRNYNIKDYLLSDIIAAFIMVFVKNFNFFFIIFSFHLI